MNFLLKKILLYTLCFLFLLSSSHAVAFNQSIPTFKAEYKLSHNNIEIGQVSLSVNQLANGQYQLRSSTKTSGLLAFIRDDDVLETSLFELKKNQLRPLSYQYQQVLGDEEKNVRLQFNWPEKTLINSSKGKTWHLTLSDGILDKALLQIALMLDLRDVTNHSLSYQVADGGKLKTYAFSPVGFEKIDVAGKQYNTLKLARQKDDKPLITYYWCAVDFYNLPILLQREKSYGTFEMRLLSVTFTD